MKKHIPNLITLLNLASGVTGILLLIRGHYHLALYMIFAAALFDFLDGLSARLLKAYTETGKSLDSLADLVSFGTLPAVLLFALFSEGVSYPYSWIVILIPCASAYRLAVFNNDPSQSRGFRGLPTPAAALFFAGLAGAADKYQLYGDIPGTILLVASVILFSLLMISRIRLFSFKSGNYRIKAVYLIISLFLIIFLTWAGLAASILLYLFVNLLFVKHFQ